ncbi:MAG: hypothetical protein ACYTFT_04220, partial [Planctomycetota bacterium]
MSSGANVGTGVDPHVYMILESGVQGGLLTPDVLQSCRNLADLTQRYGFSPADLDRLLERFWAQNGNRRGNLHRDIEDTLVGQEAVSLGLASPMQTDMAIRERDERRRTGQGVRIVSVMIDSGILTPDSARQVLDAVKAKAHFCRYCLTTAREVTTNGMCPVCGRPLTPAARTYEVVDLSTISMDTAPEGMQQAGLSPAEVAAEAEAPTPGSVIAGVKLLERVDTGSAALVY